MSIDVVLCDEVECSEGRDEGARDWEHDRHAEQQHHTRVLLAESELVPDGRLEEKIKFKI